VHGAYHHAVVISCQSTKWPFSQRQSPRASRSWRVFGQQHVNAQARHAGRLFVLRRLTSTSYSIRRSLPRTALMILVSSFIASKVDYCNVVLAGLPQRALDRVQSVVNAAARLSADAREYDHVTPLLMNLPWLRLPERVKFKLCMCAHAPLPYWSGAAIFDRAGSACRQYCSSSPALGVICWSCCAFHSPFNHRWPCVRCCRSPSVEQPTIWHSNIYIIIQHV